MTMVMAVARCIDVLSDPTMSYVSDMWGNTCCLGNMGRRRPFMLFGSIAYCVSLIFLFSPPVYSREDGGWLVGHFGFFYILFYLTNTVVCIPYDALAPELTDDYEERNSVFSLCTIFDGVGSLACVGLPIGYVYLAGINPENFKLSGFEAAGGVPFASAN